MADWAIQAIQLVWFGSDADAVKAEELYGAVFGLEAETVQRNRVPGPSNPFWGTAAGIYSAGLRGEVQVQPGRVDIVLTPAADDLPPTMPLDLLHGLEPITAALSTIGPAVRVAIVVDLVSIAQTAEAATILSQQLAALPQPINGIMDFSLQMNLRIPFASADGEQMNRLMRWSTATFQVVRFQVAGGTGTINPATELSFAAATRMDFNSVPSNRLLDTERQGAMYRDMQNELLRMAEDDPSLNQLLAGNA